MKIHLLLAAPLCLLLLPAALPANLRAPWQIQPFPAFSLMPGGPVPGLTVLGETLEFQCDSLYQEDPDPEKLLASSCRVKAAYRISSRGRAQAGLDFIGPSAQGMTVLVNGKPSVSEVTKIPMTREAAARYGAYPVCRHCAGDEPTLYSAKFKASFETGENIVTVAYLQPLASNEISYGYFQSSKWAQGFDYELWPLKEWTLAPDFKLTVSISSPKPGLLGRLFKDPNPWKCSGVSLGRRPPLPLSANAPGPGIDPGHLKETELPLQFSSDAWQGTLTFGSAFPDRLACSMR